MLRVYVVREQQQPARGLSEGMARGTGTIREVTRRPRWFWNALEGQIQPPTPQPPHMWTTTLGFLRVVVLWGRPESAG
jgi:hypothetical protein